MKIGDYIKQDHADWSIYAKITKQLKNGGFAGIVINTMRPHAVKASIGNWYPAPIYITEKDVPEYLLRKINARS